jgi:hypothetical protein
MLREIELPEGPFQPTFHEPDVHSGDNKISKKSVIATPRSLGNWSSETLIESNG